MFSASLSTLSYLRDEALRGCNSEQTSDFTTELTQLSAVKSPRVSTIQERPQDFG